jgi:hypothetical protein
MMGDLYVHISHLDESWMMGNILFEVSHLDASLLMGNLLFAHISHLGASQIGGCVLGQLRLFGFLELCLGVVVIPFWSISHIFMLFG